MAKMLLLLLVVGTFATLAAGQDYLTTPANHFEVQSETTLSGIDMYRDSLEMIVARLGRPSDVTTRRREWFTDYIYEWQTSKWRLRLITRKNGRGNSQIDSLDVWGTRPDGVIGTTGHGLKLGDAMGHARLLSRYRLATNHPSILEVDVDRGGRVNHMQLKNVCQFDLCNW